MAILILGAGWTSEFLILLLHGTKTSYAATSTTGREGTTKFVYDPNSNDLNPYKSLPIATTVLITFPLKGPNQSSHLVRLYQETHPTYTPHFIQLGSSGIWQSVENQDLWVDRKSRYDTKNDRAVAEDEILSLGGTVLNLSGLWGGSRQPRNWVTRIATSKAQLATKKSLHMIHGRDVARAILAVHRHFEKAKGERWLVTDGFVYDWYALIAGWGDGSSFAHVSDHGVDAKGPHLEWLQELMEEQNVKALPRSSEELERNYDSREFWTTFGIVPVRARMS